MQEKSEEHGQGDRKMSLPREENAVGEKLWCVRKWDEIEKQVERFESRGLGVCLIEGLLHGYNNGAQHSHRKSTRL
jgi:hypothetical protein